MTQKTIVFHSNQLSERGTEVALYNYALHNEDILGNRSIIMARSDKSNLARNRFEEAFSDVILYDTPEMLQDTLNKIKPDWFYAIKGGYNDGVLYNNGKNFIHVVFQRKQPHGDIYTYISSWLAKQMKEPGNYLPFIVDMPKPYLHQDKRLRMYFDIPFNATVFGRHGGWEEFNLGINEAILRALEEREDLYFIFMNTKSNLNHPRIKFMPATTDLSQKIEFIIACDAMIHARANGESFGMAIAEFLFYNKPVVTWFGGADQNHIEMLGDKGLYYRDNYTLYKQLIDFDRNKDYNMAELVSEFKPWKVMQKFDEMISR